MPFDFDSAPSYEQPVQEKLPTLLQYLKSVGKKKIPDRFIVMLIWKPGNFPNYTLQTEKFRAQIQKDTELYKILPTLITHCISEETTFALEIVDRDKGAIKLHPSTEKGFWKDVGTTGLRFENR